MHSRRRPAIWILPVIGSCIICYAPQGAPATVVYPGSASADSAVRGGDVSASVRRHGPRLLRSCRNRQPCVSVVCWPLAVVDASAMVNAHTLLGVVVGAAGMVDQLALLHPWVAESIRPVGTAGPGARLCLSSVYCSHPVGVRSDLPDMAIRRHPARPGGLAACRAVYCAGAAAVVRPGCPVSARAAARPCAVMHYLSAAWLTAGECGHAPCLLCTSGPWMPLIKAALCSIPP